MCIVRIRTNCIFYPDIFVFRNSEMSADHNFLVSMQKRLIFLREKKFITPSEFGNVANVNERRNEIYAQDLRATSIGRIVISLQIDFNVSELITKEMLMKYADELDKEEHERESRGE